MINFYKYEGAGNDFIMINNLAGNINFESDYIKYLCDRHFGIGADGLILIEKSEKADCFMNYYNSDGTIAEMCGNGARCVAKFFIEQTNSDLKELSLDTRAGIKKIKLNEDRTFSINMGVPILNSIDFPNNTLILEGLNFNFISMGNPHAITQVDSLDKIDINNIGPKIENNIHFPNKINVEFIEKINNENYKVKVWERGCGETLACGTGACAIYAVLNKKDSSTQIGENQKELTLEFPGGKLYLSENPEGEIILRGPAVFVFKGEININ